MAAANVEGMWFVWRFFKVRFEEAMAEGNAGVMILALLSCWFLVFSFSSYGRNRRIRNAACDVSKGSWVFERRTPLYTNETCRFIHPSQDCFKNGRADREFLNWRWRPEGCELPQLSPRRFLRSMRGKSMLFVGDSLARNHMQSLLCALTQIEVPTKAYHDNKTMEIKWTFPSFKFSLAHMWSPFLVQYTEDDNGIYRLQLDVVEQAWTSKLYLYDVAVISTGYWYFRPSVYYMNRGEWVLGSNLNHSNSYLRAAYRNAHRNVLEHMRWKFGKGTTILRTITVDHFENGTWDSGGFCNRKRPWLDHREMPWMSRKLREIQVEEFASAASAALIKMKLLDVTYSALLRPDAHPGAYRMQGLDAVNDCLHWCLPGAIDSWNEMMAHVLQL